MILVRLEFQCKAGQVREVVESFKVMSARMNGQDVIKRARVMTDLTGRFDTVVVESEVESIDAYYALLHSAFANSPLQDDANNNPLRYESGSRTLYTIEAEIEA